ncbi:SusC/RagA family TonB-linked outer membrane protein [Carboxylicivirga sediminis]|uniref:SusC/RagA family TonB-linked outer membrane protein n=1 Tax=Carboxylicivirga sediminis TaxID=2006564 RepID=A0A941F681_9BACT|nr:SusC/RagA family TonB-linked outer membrane protein [Carboxylicivirga sediminis]MBR8536693.1 SusC/RagA family TonB-linked outer membrane protein [Carboxylicivirga sediminis]
MRISVILLFGVLLQVSAASWAQKVDVSEAQTTYKELFQEVERQTGLITILSNDEMDINKEVVVKEGTFELKELYRQVLEDADMEFRIVDGYIVIKPSQKTVFIEEEAQQENKIYLEGFIVDAENNEPLLGVNVAVKGTAQGTVTDEKGTFTLVVEEQSGTLAFSYIGYEDQERPFSASSSFAIKLVPAVSSVDEVIVYATGLTKISKERATGSYSVMTRADIESSPNEEIARSLEGNVTGLQETYNPQTGENEITIRGVGTINSEQAPLIVVDGFPVEGNFSTINPNDIDNVTVLKDAAAASIWGARAGNGVIVITTRKGKNSGKFNVELGSYLKMGEELDLDYNVARASVDNQLAYEKYLVDNDYGTYWGVPDNLVDARDVYSKGVQAYWDHQRGAISEADLNATIARLKATNYEDDVKKYLLRKPVTQQHNVSISGSTDKASYYLSVLYNNVKGHFKESGDQKVLINFRNTYQLKDWLGLRFGITTEMKKTDNSGSNLGTIRDISPYEKLMNADGTYAQVDYGLNYAYMNPIAKTADGLPYDNWGYNPVEEMLNRDYITTYNNSRIQTGLDFKIIEGLHFSPSFQYEKFASKTENYNGEDTYYVRNMANDNVKYDELNNAVTEVYMPKGGILNQSFSETISYDLRNQINYDKKFGTDHEINLVAATEHIWKVTEGHGNILYGYDPESNTHAHPAYGYGSSAFNWNTLIPSYYGGSLPTGHFLRYSNTRLFSFFANGAYTFRQKYTLTGSYRTDASNMIVDDPKFRYSPFWSIGGSWNAKRESFLSDVDFLDQLTLRATYGISGNTVTTASTVPVISLSSSPSLRTGAHSGYVSDYGNPTLRWERINQLNVAVDFSLFNRLLYGSFEVYDKQSEDLLASVSVAPTYGSTLQTFNVAEVSNKGFEMSLNANLKFGDLTYNTGLNYSYNTSEVLSLQVAHIYPRTIPGYRFVEGEPVAPAYSWVYGGMNEDNLPTIVGENGITYTMNENIGSNGEQGQEVLRNMGTFIAPTVIGWSNTLQFKGFTFRSLITGKFGHVFRRSSFDYGMISRTKSFYHEDLNGLMEGKADEMGIPDLPNGYEFYSYRWGWYAPDLNTLVEDAGHIRLRELYLGYKLSDRIASSLGLDKLTVFAHARDLGTIWTANDKGIDPEYIKGNRFNPGASYTIGFNLGF